MLVVGENDERKEEGNVRGLLKESNVPRGGFIVELSGFCFFGTFRLEYSLHLLLSRRSRRQESSARVQGQLVHWELTARDKIRDYST